MGEVFRKECCLLHRYSSWNPNCSTDVSRERRVGLQRCDISSRNHNGAHEGQNVRQGKKVTDPHRKQETEQRTQLACRDTTSWHGYTSLLCTAIPVQWSHSKQSLTSVLFLNEVILFWSNYLVEFYFRLDCPQINYSGVDCTGDWSITRTLIRVSEYTVHSWHCASLFLGNSSPTAWEIVH